MFETKRSKKTNCKKSAEAIVLETGRTELSTVLSTKAFYSDEALTELSYLFQDGDSRSKILQNIVKAINDKSGRETVIPDDPATIMRHM